MANATNTASKDINALKASKFNAANTATGTDTVTINATSGVAIFTDACDVAPNLTQYAINNSLITVNSIVSVNVQSNDASMFCSLVSVYCGNGSILIGVSDLLNLNNGAPIISFQILA
jgi:hypothetical protein